MVMLDISDEGLDHMFHRAAQGAVNRDYGIPIDEEGLSHEEVAELARVLNTTEDERLKRKILQIIRYEGSNDPVAHKHIIEPFLDDLSHARDALWILCIDWGLTSQYIGQLRNFIRGKEAPLFGSNNQGLAVDIARDYLYHHKDHVLLREIIELHDKALHTHEDRGSAAIILRALFGRDGDPANSDLFVQRARDELAREEAEDSNKAKPARSREW